VKELHPEPEKQAPKLTYKVPKTIGGAIDLLFRVRGGRKELQALADTQKAQEGLIEGLIFERFGKSELEGARGAEAQCSIKRVDTYGIDDFDKVWDYAKKNDAPDLFRRQLVVEACRERYSAGKTIPGVSIFTKVSLSLTKRK
jgi:hypothetical protein